MIYLYVSSIFHDIVLIDQKYFLQAKTEQIKNKEIRVCYSVCILNVFKPVSWWSVSLVCAEGSGEPQQLGSL